MAARLNYSSPSATVALENGPLTCSPHGKSLS